MPSNINGFILCHCGCGYYLSELNDRGRDQHLSDLWVHNRRYLNRIARYTSQADLDAMFAAVNRHRAWVQLPLIERDAFPSNPDPQPLLISDMERDGIRVAIFYSLTPRATKKPSPLYPRNFASNIDSIQYDAYTLRNFTPLGIDCSPLLHPLALTRQGFLEFARTFSTAAVPRPWQNFQNRFRQLRSRRLKLADFIVRVTCGG